MDEDSISRKSYQEKRDANRDRTLSDGRVVVNGRTVDCIFFDISETGTRIGFDTPTWFPSQVYVELPDGNRVLAERRWQRGNVYGLKFILPNNI
jgi:hypothetical protein